MLIYKNEHNVAFINTLNLNIGHRKLFTKDLRSSPLLAYRRKCGHKKLFNMQNL